MSTLDSSARKMHTRRHNNTRHDTIEQISHYVLQPPTHNNETEMSATASTSTTPSASSDVITLPWKVDNVRSLVVNGAGPNRKTSNVLGVFCFTLVSGSFKMPCRWFLLRNSGSVYLRLAPMPSPSSTLRGDLVIDYSVCIKRSDDGDSLHVKSASVELGNQTQPAEADRWTCLVLDAKKTEDWNERLEADGSLSLELKVSASRKSKEGGGKADEDGSSLRIVKVEAMEVEENEAASAPLLLGDKKSSDVTIFVVDPTRESEEIGAFRCHSAVLSAHSSVFRSMFADGNKRKECESAVAAEKESRSVVKMSDVSSEVVEHFLTFIYTGRVKEDDEEESRRAVEGSEKPLPLWIQLLPKLVYMAHKYDVKELMKFCDGNLHRVVTKSNVAEMFGIAKRHGLRQAQAKLKEPRYSQLLAESIFGN